MSPTTSVVPVGSWRSQDTVDKVRDGEEAKEHVDRERRRRREGRRGDSEPECTTPLLRQEERLQKDKSLCGYSSVSQLRRSPRASDLGLGCDNSDTEPEVEVKPHRADASGVSDIPKTAVDDDFQQACSSKKCFQSSNDDNDSISHASRDLCKSRKRCRQKASDTSGEMAIHSWSNLNPSLVLENNGSVARDHLASERTFLAYVRTSLALAGSGVGLVQLMQEQETGAGAVAYAAAKPLGCILVCFGLVVLGIGEWLGLWFHVTMGVYADSPVFAS
jgi:uncharacterized membrane protein YidH (DUF202 family)